MNESDDDEGMPSLVHDSSENSSGDEGKPRKDKTKKKKKKKKPPPPGSSDDEGEPGPQTGGVGLRKGFLEQDDARGAASSSAAAAPGDGLADLTPKALKELISSAGLSTDGCIDKSDLVEQARKAKAKLAEQQVAAERERVRREEDERARAAEAESRRKREEERAAREEVQRKRDEEKRLADEHASMAKLLNECGVQGREELDHLKWKLKEARALLANGDAPRLRDAVNKAEKRRLAAEEVVGAAERREAVRSEAAERRSDLEKEIKVKTKSLKAVGAKGGTERLEAELKSLVEQAAQLDADLGTIVALPPAVAAQLALADAHARRDQEARARAEAEVRAATLESTKLGEEKLALKERLAKRDQTIEDMRKEAQSDNRKLKKDRLVKAEADIVRLTAEKGELTQQLTTMMEEDAREISQLMEQLELARATGPAGPAGVADWFKLTTPPVAPPPEEHECALCFLPRDGAALSNGINGDAPPGTEVWVRNGALSFKGAGQANEERVDVVWEGDENAPSGEPAAVRPCDMHGFIKVVLGRVKFRVQLAPTLELALENNNKLYGCSFENPRRIDKGVPLVPDAQHCMHVFHRSCIGEWKAKGKKGSSNCPDCNHPLG